MYNRWKHILLITINKSNGHYGPQKVPNFGPPKTPEEREGGGVGWVPPGGG